MLIPTYKIEYNNKNITKDVSDYVLSIEYSDYEHGQSDEITITFEDSESLWNGAWIPSKGDAPRLFIGYAGEKLLNCGIFEIDEIELNSPPDIIIVKGLATGIKKSFRQQNSVGYENKTLQQIASEVAKRHNLTLVGDIENIQVERITQNQERDLSFLKRLVILKITGYEAICNLGNNINAIYDKAIDGNTTCFDDRDNYTPNNYIRVGVIKTELPSITSNDFNIRCNQLLLKNLELLKDKIDCLNYPSILC